MGFKCFRSFLAANEKRPGCLELLSRNGGAWSSMDASLLEGMLGVQVRGGGKLTGEKAKPPLPTSNDLSHTICE